MVCAPCMLPLLGMSAAGSTGAAATQKQTKSKAMWVLIAILITLISVFIWYNRNACSTCSLDSNEPFEKLMGPHLTEKDRKMFDKYLSHIQRYFEFGSGNSTVYVSSLPHIEFIGSVENDSSWYKKIDEQVKPKKGVDWLYLYIDTHSDGMDWGNPRKIDRAAFKRYYAAYQPEYKAEMFFVDGRFRVSCCLDLYHKIDEHALIFFDDFLNRPYYHEVLHFFDVVESGEIAVILKKKANVPCKWIEMAVEKYAEDHR